MLWVTGGLLSWLVWPLGSLHAGDVDCGGELTLLSYAHGSVIEVLQDGLE